MNKKWIYLFVFCGTMFKSIHVSCMDFSAVRTIRNTGRIAKYATAFISALCAYKAVKGTVDTGRSIASVVKKDYALVDLVKLPVDLCVKFPLGVVNALKNYTFAFGFGATAYFLHRVGI